MIKLHKNTQGSFTVCNKLLVLYIKATKWAGIGTDPYFGSNQPSPSDPDVEHFIMTKNKTWNNIYDSSVEYSISCTSDM